MLRAWLGMLGIVFLLHFGIFELLAIFWINRGIAVEPLMLKPLRATSLGDFWGRRWNTAFERLAHQFAFKPLARKIGAKPAMFSVFLLSGLIHDAVISFPAGGGYGLPTLYFILQALGVAAERSGAGNLWAGPRLSRQNLYAPRPSGAAWLAFPRCVPGASHLAHAEKPQRNL